MIRRPTLIVPAVVAILAAAIAAAPFGPRNPKLPDELISVAAIDRVSLRINAMPEEIPLHDAQDGALREMVTEQLAAAGIEVAKKTITPHLVINCALVSNAEITDAKTVIVMIDVHQEASLSRLKRTLIVPTLTVMSEEVTAPDDLLRTVMQETRNATRVLIETIGEASKAMR
ncbi:MAG: hypothetical protein CMJ18_05155 [Phycisphaeraceae bacterium]|nr:hypothetical protein [Phycisphaeraceae bacterium]